MKNKSVLFGVFIFSIFFSLTAFSQADIKADSTGLPGDNFSLQGAMDLFSKATSPEDFEKAINDEKNNVNNLDLNGDGEIDYIKVIDKKESDVHAIVLQAVISENESQDIAVIEIEMKGKDDAIAQIVGDADIYGKDVYVEPAMEETQNDIRVNGDVKSGPSPFEYKAPVRLYFNVWAWPCVRFIYQPAYIVYVSPWHWHRYPSYWNPWRPMYWHNFYPRSYHYHNHYHVISQPRCYKARAAYNPHRMTSNTVKVRNEKVVNNYRTTNKIVIRNEGSRGRSVDRADRLDSRSNVDKTSRSDQRTTPKADSRDRQRTQPSDQRQQRSDVRENQRGSSERNRSEQSTSSQRSEPRTAPSRDNKPQRQERNSHPEKVEKSNSRQQKSDVKRSERSNSKAPFGQNRSSGQGKRSGRG